MKLLTGLLILLLFAANPAEAQKTDIMRSNIPDTSNPGNVNVYQDSRVDSIVAMHIRHNRHQKGIDGYRIQIFFDAGNNSLRRANTASDEYNLLYPGDSAYISFSEPYYKVRVGDFRSRFDAEAYLQQILNDYPNAFVIRDQINFPPLD